MTRALWLLLPLLAACGAPGPRGASCAGDFSLTNRSGREIEQLYAGEVRDLLDGGTIPDGVARRFQAVAPTPSILRVVFLDGRAAEIGPIDLCELSFVVVTASGMQASPR